MACEVSEVGMTSKITRTGIQVRDACKAFGSEETFVQAVDHVSLSLFPGESVSLVGPSGSGKTTLLNMMGLVLKPDAGSILVGGENAEEWGDSKRCRFRNRTFGYVFQDFALLESNTVFDNIRLPLLYNREISRSEHLDRVREMARLLGIADKLGVRAGKLSGGQKQRVALARAMVCDQPVILADEPTGQLDAENREHVVGILLSLARERGRLVVIVTHDPGVASRCDRVISLRDGRLI